MLVNQYGKSESNKTMKSEAVKEWIDSIPTDDEKGVADSDQPDAASESVRSGSMLFSRRQNTDVTDIGEPNLTSAKYKGRDSKMRSDISAVIQGTKSHIHRGKPNTIVKTNTQVSIDINASEEKRVCRRVTFKTAELEADVNQHVNDVDLHIVQKVGHLTLTESMKLFLQEAVTRRCKVETRSVNDSMGDALGEENSGTENGETKNNFGTKNREKKTNLDDKILQTMDDSGINQGARILYKRTRKITYPKTRAQGIRKQANRGEKADTMHPQTPVPKGLVVDNVHNRKPSVIRASRSANIREEFALKQRVEGFRSACSANISRINYERRRLSTNLINLKNKMATDLAARAVAIDADALDAKRSVSSGEMFLRNKGYFPDGPPSKPKYIFPHLNYPTLGTLITKS